MSAPETPQKALVNWGIVGSGHISYAFCLSLARLNSPRHRLVAVASRSSLAKAEEFATKFKLSRFYGNYDELVNDPEINAVYVGNLTPDHLEVSLAAIKAGKAILVEKPLTMSFEDSKRVIEASRTHGVLAVEAMWSRFMPPFERIREIMRGGNKPMSLMANFVVPIQKIDRIAKPELGGGALRDIGIYGLQLATMLFGGVAPVQICSTGFGNEYGVDIADSVALKYANGGCASILVDSRCGARDLTEARIFFEPGGSVVSIKLCAPFYVTTKLEILKADGTTSFEHFPIYTELAHHPDGLAFRNPASQALAYEAEAFADVFEKWSATRGTQNVVIEHPLRTHDETLIDAHIIDKAIKQWLIFPN